MNLSRRAVLGSVLVLAIAGSVWAQQPGHGGGMGFGMPSMPGLQNPTLGKGSEYQLTTKNKVMDMSIVALGKENVEGETGYGWAT